MAANVTFTITYIGIEEQISCSVRDKNTQEIVFNDSLRPDYPRSVTSSTIDDGVYADVIITTSVGAAFEAQVVSAGDNINI